MVLIIASTVHFAGVHIHTRAGERVRTGKKKKIDITLDSVHLCSVTLLYCTYSETNTIFFSLRCSTAAFQCYCDVTYLSIGQP